METINQQNHQLTSFHAAAIKSEKESLLVDSQTGSMRTQSEDLVRLNLLLAQLSFNRLSYGENYRANMPRLKSVVMMCANEVFDYLQSLETSIYYSMPMRQIVEGVSINDGQRYLAELCLLNSRAKSSLEDIMECEEEMSI